MSAEEIKEEQKKIINNIVEIRGMLHNDRTNKDIFPEVWFELSGRKHQAIKNLSDFLVVDDFYSVLFALLGSALLCSFILEHIFLTSF